MKLSPLHRLSGAVATVAATFVLVSPAAALTTRYEAENYVPSSQAWRATINPSGTGYLSLFSTGHLEIPVTTAVKSVTTFLRGETCKNPVETKPGYTEYQIRTYPGYHQQDAFINPITPYGFDSWAAPVSSGLNDFTLPYGGYVTPGTLTGGAANRVQVEFIRDYSRWVNGVKECDRNLHIDYVEVVS